MLGQARRGSIVTLAGIKSLETWSESLLKVAKSDEDKIDELIQTGQTIKTGLWHLKHRTKKLWR